MFLLKQWGSRVLLPIVLAALAVLAYERQWLLSIDYLLYDSAQQWRKPTVLTDSVIIAIDEQSIASIGRWPWSRDVHAQLINQLYDSGSKAVYFDVLFSDASISSEDLALAAAIDRHGQVILPMTIEPLGDQGQLIEVVPAMTFYEPAKAIGHAHINCDFDGVCRSLYLREGVGQPRWPHLSAALWPFTQNTVGARALPAERLSALLIYRDFHNFIPFSPADSVPKISYIDVLEGRIPTNFLAGKTIFIGATAAGVHDILTTPVGRLPGVEITALIYHHLYQGTLIQLYEGRLSALLLGALLVLFLAGISVLSSSKLLLGVSALLLVESSVAFYLLVVWNRWLPVAPLLMATLLFYPLWSWLRLELAMRYLKRSLLAHQRKSPPSIRLVEHFNVQPSKPHWLVASDTVALTIEQLEAISLKQEVSYNLLQQSMSGLQEGCIIFSNQGCCFLVNTLATAWLPRWHSESIFDIEHSLNIHVESWAVLIHDTFNQQETLCCAAEALVPDEAGLLASYFLQLQHCKIQLEGKSKPVTVGVLTLTDISELKASERLREETLNFISHDLRSPLVSIISLIKHHREMFTVNDQDDHALTDLLAKIERYANRNLAYSESLLQLNRAEQLSVNQAVLCDLLAVCEDAYEQVLPFAREHHCPLICEFDEHEFWLDGDYELLQRAVVNLLTNAVKYGASTRGVILSLALTAAHANSAQPQQEGVNDSGGELIALTVQDFGIGMTLAQQAHAFERFTRDASASEGAGLGLYFIKTVVQNHLGQLQLRSEPNAGCIITCLFPLKKLTFMD
ncbi:CHASE2 domain-containing protein [Marinagarivorans algicola]|uniref:CHASE2 domain-containing protein n=1 Tax=Marinagarivorans algicola TaxID=1513270 RepID=UPI003735D359